MEWICIISSAAAIVVAVSLVTALPELSLIWTIGILATTQIASCIFFPIVIGKIIDEVKAKREFSLINRFYRDFREGGIIDVYKDREDPENAENTDNGVAALKKAFDNHHQGEVKLIGVSLRVFFKEDGRFYNNIKDLGEKNKTKGGIEIKALINSSSAPEISNREEIEGGGRAKKHAVILKDLSTTKSIIDKLNKTYAGLIIVKEYIQAPYCTAMIFPEKCFISQNILCKDSPVKLPLIIFERKSPGYTAINDYFEYLWMYKKSSDSKKQIKGKE